MQRAVDCASFFCVSALFQCIIAFEQCPKQILFTSCPGNLKSRSTMIWESLWVRICWNESFQWISIINRKTHGHRKWVASTEKHVLKRYTTSHANEYPECDSNLSVCVCVFDSQFWIINWPVGNHYFIQLVTATENGFNSNKRVTLSCILMCKRIPIGNDEPQRMKFMIYTDVDRWQIGYWFNLASFGRNTANWYSQFQA